MPYDDRDDEVEKVISKLQAPQGAPKCVLCASEKVFPAMLWSAERFRVSVMADPQALLFKGWETFEVTARVCSECGNIQFIAEGAAILYAVYLQSLKAGKVERKDTPT